MLAGEAFLTAENRSDQGQGKAPFRVYHYVLYLLVLSTFAGFLYVFPFLILRLPGFNRWSNSPQGKKLEYGFTTQIDADVVIFGDSSAMYGVNPRLIGSTLDLKVVNLPNTIGSITVSGDLELQHYLRSHPTPKLIVIYLAPWNLDYIHKEKTGNLYEGEEMLVRHGSFQDISRFAQGHVLDFLQFPFRFYAVNSFSKTALSVFHSEQPSEIERNFGHMDMVTYGKLGTTCQLPANFNRTTSTMDSLQYLTDRYRQSADRIMLFIAPIPFCNGIQDLDPKSLAGLHVAPPKRMPPESFHADGYYIHPVPSAVPEVTQGLTEAIRTELALTRTGQ